MDGIQKLESEYGMATKKAEAEKKKEITLKDATVDQLKVMAFDTEQKIKLFQSNLNIIFEELRDRFNKGKDNG